MKQSFLPFVAPPCRSRIVRIGNYLLGGPPFDGFDPARITRYGKPKSLLRDDGIVRNRLKIDATVANARAYFELIEHGFADFVWGFVDGEPKVNRFRHTADVPASTPESHEMSRELKRLGFRFVGPTICYAFMQAVGMVTDHLTRCFRRAECASLGR